VTDAWEFVSNSMALIIRATHKYAPNVVSNSRLNKRRRVRPEQPNLLAAVANLSGCIRFCPIYEVVSSTPNGAQAQFTFCSELYERVAMIVITNLKFADWTQVFGGERLTAAILDRLTHHAHILELLGESYRFRQRMEQEVG